MNLNKYTQYGVLFALYLSRAGRARVEDAAINLNLSRSFLEQVARKMRIHGVIVSVRGPGGGYELVPEAKMSQVFEALIPVSFLTSDEQIDYSRGEPEQRAFAHYATTLGLGLFPLLNRKVKSVMQELVVNEMSHLNKLDIQGLEN